MTKLIKYNNYQSLKFSSKSSVTIDDAKTSLQVLELEDFSKSVVTKIDEKSQN